MYQIIKSAEQYPNVEAQPFRAIFAAYEKILPENGLDPDHDQVYLRFLFKLGDGRAEGQSLYERFEALLEALGYQIEFVPDEEGIQEATRNITPELNIRNGETQFRGPNRSQRRSRRASFASMYDAEDESTRTVRSRASMSRLENTEQALLEDRPSTRATTRKSEKTNTQASASRSTAAQASRGRLTAQEFANNVQHYQRRRRSVSSHGEQHSRDFGAPTPLDTNSRIRAASSVQDYSPGANELAEDVNEVPAVPPRAALSYSVGRSAQLYSSSRTQLLRDADTFYGFRIRSVARDVVDKWCFAALQAKDQHERMDRLASAHDTEILIRQAFEHWRIRLHAKKQAIAIERYFVRLEQKATKARDLMLLSKAFTHWVQCARDEALRTSSAREQILGMKYFRAWRSITIENQLKTRHQGLRKFFGLWKRRYVQSLTDDIKACLIRRQSLARNAYWHWFWGFCERRAPEWRARRIKRKYFFNLISAYSDSRRRDQQVTALSNNMARGRIFSQWLGKAQAMLYGQQQAVSFVRQKRTAHALQAWRLANRYAPLARQVSNMVDWRVAGMTFAAFVTRYRLEKQAETVCRLRVLRNTFTQWNDRLRSQTLAHRIDDRYCLEVLYKWVIAERAILLCRLLEERLKQRCLDSLRDECESRESQRHHSRQIIEDARSKNSLRDFLYRWRFQLDSQRQAEQVAFEFHAPKIAQGVLDLWSRSSADLRKLDGWAKDAYYYFTCRKYLKRWQAASVESKKNKRRNAYVQVRRRLKMKLAASFLRRWRFASAQVNDLQQEANLTYQNQLFRVGVTLFDYWRTRFAVNIDQDYQAVQHYNRRLVERHLYTWIERAEDQSKLEELADLNYDMRVKNVAFGWLHKLRLRLIELKGREAKAENLKSWYQKRHYHNLLRQWQDKTAERHEALQGDQVPSARDSRIHPQREGDGLEGATSRAEEFTEFDIGEWIPALEAQSSTAPLLGYLSTPSRRAARAKALVRVSTTPAGSPFEHRLRSQFGSTSSTARRGLFGRSTAGLRGSTFGAILEAPDSPVTPGAGRGG